jgi:hypothetical protein
MYKTKLLLLSFEVYLCCQISVSCGQAYEVWLRAWLNQAGAFWSLRFPPSTRLEMICLVHAVCCRTRCNFSVPATKSTSEVCCGQICVFIVSHRQKKPFFKIILQNYATVWNFCSFFNQPPCATAVWKATAMAHGGKGATNGPLRGPRQPIAVGQTVKGCARRGRRRYATTVVGTAAVVPI